MVTRLSRQQVESVIEDLPQDQVLDELAIEDALLWFNKNIRTEKGVPVEFVNRPYLVQMICDFHPEQRWKKAAQTGGTHSAIGKVLYVCDYTSTYSLKDKSRYAVPITCIYTFPTKGDVMEFSKARFTTIIRDSHYLNSMIKDYDSAGMKQVGESTLYFKGTIAERQAISVPSDLNVHDELDFSNPSVRTTYSNRLDASRFIWHGEVQEGWTWDFSTPTIPDYGIDRLYKESDRHVWLVKCTACNLWQTINFFNNVLPMKKKKGDHYYGCRKCSGKLDRTIGKWKPKNPKSRFRGYYVSQMMSGIVSAQKLVNLWNEAPLKPKGIKNFYNFNLGLAYEVGDNVLTKALIKKHIIPGTVAEGDIYLGADQGDVIHIEVTKVINGRRHIIEIAKVHSFDELESMIKHYKPKISVIDALPNHHNAVQLAKKFPNVFTCLYNGDSMDKEEYFNREDKEVNIPRTDVLDYTAALWKLDQVLIESYISTPMIDEFVVQMTNMKRDLEEDKRTQEQKAIWKRVGPDHFRHADVYNWIAFDIGVGTYSDVALASAPDPTYSTSENIFSADEQW